MYQAPTHLNFAHLPSPNQGGAVGGGRRGVCACVCMYSMGINIFKEFILSSAQRESSYGHYRPLDHMSTDKLITETLWEDLYDM